jgi:transcriptional regulator with XRE-family HTH domain
MDERKRRIIEKLKDREYRDAFAKEHIDTGIPFQIRALRKQQGRKWTQKQLGKRAGMAQETISRIEDPNYGKLTLETLKRLASAFDIGLMVRFVPFSELVDWEVSLTPTSLEAASFDKDFYSGATGREKTAPKETEITVDRKKAILTAETSSTGKIYHLKDYLPRRVGRSFVPQKAAVGFASRS